MKTWLKQGSNGLHQATADAIIQVSVRTVATWTILANFGLKTRKKGEELTDMKIIHNSERREKVIYRYPDM